MIDQKLENEYFLSVQKASKQMTIDRRILEAREQEANKLFEWNVQERNRLISLEKDLKEREDTLAKDTRAVNAFYDKTYIEATKLESERKDWEAVRTSEKGMLDNLIKVNEELRENLARQIEDFDNRVKKYALLEENAAKIRQEYENKKNDLERKEGTIDQLQKQIRKQSFAFEENAKLRELALSTKECELSAKEKGLLDKENNITKMTEEFNNVYGARILELEEKEKKFVDRENEIRILKTAFQSRNNELEKKEIQVADKRATVDQAWNELTNRFKQWQTLKETQTT